MTLNIYVTLLASQIKSFAIASKDCEQNLRNSGFVRLFSEWC